MRRVLIGGISGSGKTTLARRLEAQLGLPRYELDALHHGPGWVKRPSFEEDVSTFSNAPAWVTEDQYQSFLGELLWERADTFVWLDLPKRVVMWRVVTRSVSRAVMRTELWNGNRERWGDWFQADHPMLWAWRKHGARRERTAAIVAQHPDINVVRLRTAREVRAWLRTLDATARAPD